MSLVEFEGPRGRYHRAQYELDNPDITPSEDVWVIKLKQLLTQRAAYESAAQYSEENPLFSTLLAIFENDSISSRKHMLEAMLVTGEDFNTIAEHLKDPVIPDGLVVGLYHELFYTIRPHLSSVPAMYRYVVQPLMSCNGKEIPIGSIWKLLAYTGGMEILEASGFGTRPISAEDVYYLAQLGGYRYAAMMLKYIADGDLFVKDNPIAMNIVLGLSEMAQQVTSLPERDKFGFKKTEAIVGTDYSHVLTGLFKMVYETDNLPEIPDSIEERLITCKPTKIDAENGTN